MEFICPKCNNKNFKQGQFQATGSNLSKIFDVQTEKYTTISCTQCGFTEIYKATTSKGSNVVDALFGG